ncbi:MAG: HlyD family efflux transporter periplasmic adaptor subunit [Xanthomonadales bacterium]|nr:HlyD family efflux transporter periplasmic adaptor subunit [Xanthomonadales bacterium]MCB1626642.1 HlyD family efflux transporter periplasmic adaptor subunit [Xanthomonadales bacterium]
MFRDTSAQDRVMAAPSAWQRWRWPAAVAAAVLLLGAVAVPSAKRWISADAAVSQQGLRLAVVQRGDLVRDVAVQGRVVAANSPSLYAPSAGTVTLHVEAGEAVEAGQLLAEIDNPELESLLAQGQSRLQALQTEVARQRIETRKLKLASQRTADEAVITLRAAERELERSRQGHKVGALSEVELRRAEDALDTAQVRLRHAQADAELEAESLGFELRNRELELQQQQLAVTELERQVDQLGVRSPLQGQIGSLAVQQKAKVASDQALLTVIDLSRLEVEIEVAETLADDLAPGMAAELKLGNALIAGELRQVSPEVIDGQVRGRIALPETLSTELRQNQRLSGRILLDQRNDVLLVERGPFLDNDGGRFAYVISDGIAQRQPIRIGGSSMGAVEITEGLAEGDQIIISSTSRFAGAERVLISQ